MYGLPDTLRPLSAAEEQVMLAVWACPGAAARRDISQKLKATGWAAATVLNFLYRLEEKGWVRSAKQGNCNVYVPLVTRRAYGVYCMRQRLDTLFDGDLAAAVHALVSESGCSQSALEQAIRVLEEKHQERSASGNRRQRSGCDYGISAQLWLLAIRRRPRKH